MSDDLYLVALGSNMRHRRFGAPRSVLAQALEFMQFAGAEVLAASPVIRSRPIGPSDREFANAAAIISYGPTPRATLAMLQGIEMLCGRQRRGQKWRARVLDLDIILWSGGIWADPDLVIPHPHFRTRDFVLGPAQAIAPDWRDPLTGLTIAHLAARLR